MGDSWADDVVLNHLFLDLGSKDDDVTIEAARELRDYVASKTRDQSGEVLLSFIEELNRRIGGLLGEQDSAPQKGAIRAIGELLNVDLQDENVKSVKFANFLRARLPNPDEGVMELAAETLGKLACGETSLAHSADLIVEFETNRALEWLNGPRQEMRRYGAVLLLRELSKLSTLFFSYIPQVFDAIWEGVRDPKMEIRTAAIKTLEHCLALLVIRQEPGRQVFYDRSYEEVLKGFGGNADAVHGALLALSELLKHWNDFQYPRVSDVCRRVVALRDHKTLSIRIAVITLLPTLAELNPTEFVDKHLKTCMEHMLKVVKVTKEKEPTYRGITFIALGRLGLALPEPIAEYLKEILAQVNDALTAKKRGRPFCHEALTCVSLLAKARGAALQPLLEPILDQMFSYGLSAHLISALEALAAHIPELKSTIQSKVLDLVALILSDKPYRHPGTPARVKTVSTLAALESDKGFQDALREDRGNEQIQALALRTLGTFDFSDYFMHEFIEQCVFRYLEKDNADVRRQAAVTCHKLISTPSWSIPPPFIHQVLRKLLAVAVADPSLSVRLTVLQALNGQAVDPEDDDDDTSITFGDSMVTFDGQSLQEPLPRPGRKARGNKVRGNLSHRDRNSDRVNKRYTNVRDTTLDMYLAQEENLRALFLTLNDPAFQNRQTAIQLLGRLSLRNPAYVLPALRTTLKKLLAKLEYSGDSRNKEESAKLLGSLIMGCHGVIKPYVHPIMKRLIPKLRESENSILGSHMLAALAEVCRVGGSQVNVYIDEVLGPIIDTVQDQVAPARREVALNALCELVFNTGYVIKPYLDHPRLLNMLLTILKSNQPQTLRREVMKVIGTLGAVDPFVINAHLAKAAQGPAGKRDNRLPPPGGDALSDADIVPAGINPSSPDYFPNVAVHSVMRMLRNPSLAAHHRHAIQTLVQIFVSLGQTKTAQFLKEFIPAFLPLVRTCEQSYRSMLFQHLGTLIVTVKQHVRHYLSDIFTVILDFWHPSLVEQVVAVVEHIARCLTDEFKAYLPRVLPKMLLVLQQGNEYTGSHKLHVLRAFETFGTSLDEYVDLVVEGVVELLDEGVDEKSRDVVYGAVQTLGRLCRILDFSAHSSRIVHALLSLVSPESAHLTGAVITTVRFYASRIGTDFVIFNDAIMKVLNQYKMHDDRLVAVLENLRAGKPAPSFDDDPPAQTEAPIGAPSGETERIAVNPFSLQQAWRATHLSVNNDWFQWIRNVSVQLLRQSSSSALRACWLLAQNHPPLARQLFNASFVSCWTELVEESKQELIRSLEYALDQPNIPAAILQQLLNLAEFMDRDGKPLPIDIRKLGALALKCRAFAKALRYKEMEYLSADVKEYSLVEALISVNNQLHDPAAAAGVLVDAKRYQQIELKSSLYEILNQWQEAHDEYSKYQQQDPLNLEYTLGRMRCLRSLGEWEQLAQLSHERWESTSDLSDHHRIAPLAAEASWNLGRWDDMEVYIQQLDVNKVNGVFMRAVAAVHNNEYAKAMQFIRDTRDLLDTELVALVGESYNRAYNLLILVQQLAELEEVIVYKQADEPRRRDVRQMWAERLHGGTKTVETWQRIQAVRSLVLTPEEDSEVWLQFAALCRDNKQFSLCYKIIVKLLGYDPKDPRRPGPLCPPKPRVTYALLQYMWEIGQKGRALELMTQFVPQIRGDNYILARCHLTLGKWQRGVTDELQEGAVPLILNSFAAAAEFDPEWYPAWHEWAMTNYEAIQHYEKVDRPHELAKYVVPAVTGFVRAITLSEKSTLQDALRLLTLWFKYGAQRKVEEALRQGLEMISIDTWLEVIPQIIARIHNTQPAVRQLVATLLTRIGRTHPQALVYPLAVAAKSPSVPRKIAADTIIDSIREHSPNLVDQALMVSKELIRVSILWNELWYDAIEDASRWYFAEKNVDMMFKALKPCHDMMKDGPQTTNETQFVQSFGRDLKDAQDLCNKYLVSKDNNDISRAWDYYLHVFRQIQGALPKQTSFELQHASPRLAEAIDLDLAVPGTYRPNMTVINIGSFDKAVSIINSKQRPRKINIQASDGTPYKYLLKGHEDLRQDERAMQLFGLVNTLLAQNLVTSRNRLSIERYEVIPLSPNSGLLSWVRDCDTFHALMREYRKQHNVFLDYEHRLMQQMAPAPKPDAPAGQFKEFDNLTVVQKIEVFEYALNKTSGDDLAKIFWLKSPNAETWYERRLNYTRTLAVMSMVGYILGLGDRHPSNIMIGRYTGKVLHIDFGDCFEIAIHRERYAEKIPFRLTRMLINAMEVSGVEGNFRTTCESTMGVLRNNKDSLMAVLEAFVYDPLISWRLGTAMSPADSEFQRSGSSAALPVVASTRPRKNSVTDGVNEKAVQIVTRVSSKLTGRDFPDVTLDVPMQVDRLVREAMDNENLCQCFVGWCPFW